MSALLVVIIVVVVVLSHTLPSVKYTTASICV